VSETSTVSIVRVEIPSVAVTFAPTIALLLESSRLPGVYCTIGVAAGSPVLACFKTTDVSPVLGPDGLIGLTAPTPATFQLFTVKIPSTLSENVTVVVVRSVVWAVNIGDCLSATA